MSSGRLIFGIILVAIGALFLLDNFADAVNIGTVWQWWPMLLVLFGVWRLVADRFRSLFLPLLLIAIGGLLQLRKLEIIPGIDFATYWPIIPIVIGIAILAGGITRGRRRRRRERNRNRQRERERGNRESANIIDAESFTVFAGDSLDATLSTDNRTMSGDFQSGSINIVMGSGELDLRGAYITAKPATMNVSIVMGEAKLRVPSDWNVQSNATNQMAETHDTRSKEAYRSETPDLIIEGKITMGSLHITD